MTRANANTAPLRSQLAVALRKTQDLRDARLRWWRRFDALALPDHQRRKIVREALAQALHAVETLLVAHEAEARLGACRGVGATQCFLALLPAQEGTARAVAADGCNNGPHERPHQHDRAGHQQC